MASIILWPADRRVEKDNGDPAADGTLTIRQGGTNLTATAWTDEGLSVEQSVFAIGSDGYLESRVTIYGRSDLPYDAYVQSTNVNGSSAWTIPLNVADTSIADESNTEIAMKNAVLNGDLALWTLGTSFSNISGSNNPVEIADGIFFIQSTAASNAISQQAGYVVGSTSARARYTLRFGRPSSSTSTNKLRLAGLIPTADVYRLRGQQVTLSFDAVAGDDFSGGTLGVKVASGTSEGESAALIESSGFAGNVNELSSAASVSATAQRFEFTFTLEDTIKEIGWQISYTGSGTAGAADHVTIQNVMLEIASAATEFTAPPETVEYLMARLSAMGREFIRFAAAAPGADRGVFWDHSALGFAFYTLPTGLAFSGAGLVLADDLAALEGLSSTGFAVRSALNTWVQRSIAGTANEINVGNGDGVSANPTISLATSLTFTGKTITGGTFSGPTLSGTVAGTPTIASAWIWSTAQNLPSGSQVAGSNILTAATGFQKAGDTITGNIYHSASVVRHNWDESDASSNQRRSRLTINGGVITYALFDDAESGNNKVWSLTRSGASPLVYEFDNCDLRIEPNPASIATNSAGFLGVPLSRAVTASITLAPSDAGKHISIAMSSASQTVTIPPNSSVALPTGTVITLRGAASGNTFTIIEGSGVTLTRGDGIAGSGTRTAPTGADRIITLFKIDTNAWEITGAFT